MASVQSSRGKRYELITAYGEEPTLHIESEGDKLIRDLSFKQLDTKLTLEKQKTLEKEFERGSGFVPLSVHDAGSSTVRELQNKIIREEKLEKLQLLGLSFKEANAVLNGEDLSFPDSKVETSVKNARAEQIKNVVESREEYKYVEEITGSDILSRHEKELALAVKPDSTETKLLQFALSCQSSQHVRKDLRPPDHPIHQLHELEQSLFCKQDPLQLVKTVRRKRVQLLESCQPPQGPKFMKKSDDKTKKSLWDQVEEHCIKKVDSNKAKTYSCSKERFYTIRNGKIIEVDNKKKIVINSVGDKDSEKSSLAGLPFINLSSSVDNSDICDDDDVKLKRLTEEDIKALPQFKNYHKGVCSNVLYLKNLASNLNEDDLVDLFKRFQRPDQPSIVYRFMMGKMHGQAFVTFPNKQIAEEALEKINGTILKGKPVIIQFGKT